MSDEEMAAVFNLGIGMVAVVSPDDVAGRPTRSSGPPATSAVIGEIVAGRPAGPSRLSGPRMRPFLGRKRRRKWP